MASAWWYRLDADDVVREVGLGWDEFALANGGHSALAEHVVGRSLFDFVTGSPARQLTRDLLRTVRSRPGPVEVPFRCDAPDRRRYMNWSGHVEEDEGILIRTRLLDESARSTERLISVARAREGDHVTVCSWCNRIRVDDAEWAEPEHATRRLALFMGRDVPALTHGICFPCRDAVQNGSG